MARDEGERRHQHRGLQQVARCAGLRPDERAARRAPARGAVRPDRGRVLPRRRGQGRAAVHRQHLPLHAGRLRSVGAARPHAVGRRLPAHAGHRDGRAAGAHHLDARRARSRRCRPSTCPPTTTPTPRRPRPSRTSTPRRTCRARIVELGIYPAVDPLASTSRILDPHIVGEEHYGTARARAAGAAAVQGPAGHHRHPRHRRAVARTTS